MHRNAPGIGAAKVRVDSVTAGLSTSPNARLHLVASTPAEDTMGFTDKFKGQHDEILAIAGEITDKLKRKPDPAAIRKLLSNLAGKVNFHLAMEDKALYPRLMEHKDASAKALATKFMKDMGGLAQVFTDYNNKWQVSAIKSDPDGFSTETRKVFGALAHRISRENAELYPLADAAS
jgi:hypothetical protein